MTEPMPVTERVCSDCNGRGRTTYKASYFGKVLTRHCFTCGGTGQVTEAKSDD